MFEPLLESRGFRMQGLEHFGKQAQMTSTATATSMCVPCRMLRSSSGSQHLGFSPSGYRSTDTEPSPEPQRKTEPRVLESLNPKHPKP